MHQFDFRKKAERLWTLEWKGFTNLGVMKAE